MADIQNLGNCTKVRISGRTSSVCLSMIVKNEAPVIERCLASVRSLIDYWIIVDTGSTDGTQDIIRHFLTGVPGELHEREWVDFATNRNEALDLARHKAEYTLVIDADDALICDQSFHFGPLDKDGYLLRIEDTAITYARISLVANSRPWRYVGVLHEFLACDGTITEETLEGCAIRRSHDGARRRDPTTYKRDAEMLEKALHREPAAAMRSRYVFYLAQSYRDSGQQEKALQNYLWRAELGHWEQEVYISLIEAARLLERLGRSQESVISTYARAIRLCPWRGEAYHGAARYHRCRNQFDEGYNVAKQALALQPQAHALFLSNWIYDFGLLDEYAICAFWTGRYTECRDACRQILSRNTLEEGDRLRIAANEAAAKSRIDSPTPALYSISTWVPHLPQGGTEIMLNGLHTHLGADLDRIELHINMFDPERLSTKKSVVWMHHNVDQAAVKWCRNAVLVDKVSYFVFVSYWQRDQYIREYNLPVHKCFVLRNAVVAGGEMRAWNNRPVWKVAYTSTPFRGLSVLLDAWERLKPSNAELHVWSSWKLYGEHHEHGYEALLERTRTVPGVHYRGIVPNSKLRDELREIDFLAYPSTFAETSCLSVIEAMAAGCRVICSSLGALPETTSGFARLYPQQEHSTEHAEVFASTLADELQNPWGGDSDLSLVQQSYTRTLYSWSFRQDEWRRLIREIETE